MAMKVLGICASYRKLGNCEVLVRETLEGAEEAGAETEFLRLTDERIEPCRGCMRCVFKGLPCPIDDGVHAIHQKLKEADAVVVAVPNYILGAAGIFKKLMDRSMALMFPEERPMQWKPAVAMVAYGVRGWEGFALAQVNTFLLSIGCTLVDSFCALCQGPGEVALQEEVLLRCHENGRKLASGIRGKPSFEGICPVCGGNLIEVVDLKVRCPVCNIYGHIIVEDGRLGVKFDNPENNRWTPENMKRHFEREMLPSAERYIKERAKIKELTKRYREKA